MAKHTPEQSLPNSMAVTATIGRPARLGLLSLLSALSGPPNGTLHVLY